jgi:hypothetical protein
MQSAATVPSNQGPSSPRTDLLWCHETMPHRYKNIIFFENEESFENLPILPHEFTVSDDEFMWASQDSLSDI